MGIDLWAIRSKIRLEQAVERFGAEVVARHDQAQKRLQETVRTAGGNPESIDILVGLALALHWLTRYGMSSEGAEVLEIRLELLAEAIFDARLFDELKRLTRGLDVDPGDDE